MLPSTASREQDALRIASQAGRPRAARVSALACAGVVAARRRRTAAAREYIMVYEQGAGAGRRRGVKAAGGTCVSANKAVGVATVRSDDADFAGEGRAQDGLEGTATEPGDRAGAARRAREPLRHRAPPGCPQHAPRQTEKQAKGSASGRPRASTPERLADLQWGRR